MTPALWPDSQGQALKEDPTLKQVSALAAPSSQPTVSRLTAVDSEKGMSDFEAGLAARSRNELIAARNALNRALGAGLPAAQTETARQTLSEIANLTIFSTTILAGDPLVESHQVEAGETLGKLARQYSISEDLLTEVNNVRDKHFIRLGMRLKVVHGPFHCTITKSEHLLHVYLAETYVRSYRVALGADGKTPTGRWKVANHQTNPGWVDPHTGKRFHPDDPNNPIGEYWIGLEGIEGAAVGAYGYGIHGTNEPKTIGQDVSLGCVRWRPLTSPWSTSCCFPARRW